MRMTHRSSWLMGLAAAIMLTASFSASADVENVMDYDTAKIYISAMPDLPMDQPAIVASPAITNKMGQFAFADDMPLASVDGVAIGNAFDKNTAWMRWRRSLKT